MLEYLDFDSRKAILETIYSEYVEEKSKNVSYGITPPAVIADWENFRYKWIRTNLLDPLQSAKAGAKK